jgi:hypothetical protein
VKTFSQGSKNEKFSMDIEYFSFGHFLS